MYALVLASAHRLGFLGSCKSPVHAFGFLWAGDEFAQPVRAASKVVAVANNQRGKLQFSRACGYLEQFGDVGGGCGQRRTTK